MFCPPSFLGFHQGDRFVMENSNGEVVRRSKEGDKFVATAMDMVQERVNKSTRDTEAVVFVQDERSRTVSIQGKGRCPLHATPINRECNAA